VKNNLRDLNSEFFNSLPQYALFQWVKNLAKIILL
jgi:hypothetical protein